MQTKSIALANLTKCIGDSKSHKRYWELLHVLVDCQLKVHYRGYFLGIYWLLLNSLPITGFYTAIFGIEFRQYYGNSISNHVLSVFIGLVIINFFSASTMQALSSVVQNGNLLNKVGILVSFGSQFIILNH
jgi:lipopolysaccharide transport system permease protein